jgi:hypothetical protein
MTEETAPTPEKSPDSTSENAPRARRVAKPRPKKVAAVNAPQEPAASEYSSIPFPSLQKKDQPSEESSQTSNDWPEPETESAGPPISQSEAAKRKRRRRKGKGKSGDSPNVTVGPIQEESHPLVPQESKAPEPPQELRQKPQPSPGPQPRVKMDPELLTKMAWKIYLAEVSEEGVALIGDQDAKDLSRRCFRLAEIFIEEQTRRR